MAYGLPMLKKLSLSKSHKVAVMAGDGVGREVMPEALKVLDAVCRLTGIELEYDHIDWPSCDYHARHGRMMPDHWKEVLQHKDAILFGTVGRPDTVADTVSSAQSVMKFRRELAQYVHLRPARLMAGVASPLGHREPGVIDMVVVRETTEDQHAPVGGVAFEGMPHELVVQQSMLTKAGTDRVLKYAFELARSRSAKQLTVATKSNIPSIGMPWWEAQAAAMARLYPDVHWNREQIEILVSQFVQAPHRFDVVVASNLFGEILADLASTCTGTLGIAPSAYLNPERAYPSLFEPAHGPAPAIAGRNIANPVAMVWAGALMLDFLGHHQGSGRLAHDLILQAIESTLRLGPHTADLGGTALTTEVGTAIAAQLGAPGATLY
jgi:tartrate dehydrogenase/decarboxylase/D-malate dehydrogenase